MTRDEIVRAVGCSIMIGSGLAWAFRRRPRADATRCCDDAVTCLCGLNRTFYADLMKAVRSIPRR